MSQTIWHVKNCSLFEKLSDDQLTRLESRARIRSFPRNSAIYLPNDVADGAFLLAEGRVRICSMTSDGKQAILDFIKPGELFGELGLIHEGERDERAEAAVNSTVYLLPGDDLRKFMQDSAELTLGVSKLIGMRRKRVERRLRSLLFRSNRDRLGHLLLELLEQYGKTISEGILIDVRISHQELASIIGATRETVTALLGEMQYDRLINVGRQRIVVRDAPRLARLVDASVPIVSAPSHVSPPHKPPVPITMAGKSAQK